jgi:hypothetical protein
LVTSSPAPTIAHLPSLQLSPEGGVEPGGLVVVTGDGWTPGDEVSADLVAAHGEVWNLLPATVSEDGTFVAPFLFPSELPWSSEPGVIVRVTSLLTGYEQSITMPVVLSTATVSPTLTVTSTAQPIATTTPTALPTAEPTGTASPLPGPTATTGVPSSPTATPVSTAAPTPTPQPWLLGWRGEYFNNRYLSGSPVLIRDDANVSFVWGTAAPTPALPADGFSVRWARTLAFEGGTYRFHVTADDGVRVWLDGGLVIDEWHEAPSASYTTDRLLSSGTHSLRVEYYEGAGSAQIQFWWERLGEFPQWRGEYFPRVDLVGSPSVVRNDPDLNFDWRFSGPSASVPVDGFSARWTRDLWLDDGTYRFHGIVDDGMRLYVDGAQVIDAWSDGGRREVTGDRRLAAGTHTVRVEYYERTGEAAIRVWWERIASYPDWKGEYWSNRYLIGSPAVVRNDAAIDFAWGWTAPVVGLPIDGFSVRWTRAQDFDAATYRFHVLVDDGARLYIDDRLVIDTWHDGAAREVTAEQPLAQGSHALRVEYYDRTAEARVRVWWEKIPTTFPDWKGEYWSNRGLTGKPAFIRNDREIDFDWGNGIVAAGLPADDFSARWRREVSFKAGAYRIQARADDGVRVYLDGRRILDEWHGSDGREVYWVDRDLKGEHVLEVEYYERTGKAMLEVWWYRLGDLPTPTPTKKPASTSTATPTATATSTPEATGTPTSTSEPTATATSTLEPTATPLTPEPTVTSPPTLAPTATPTPTSTPEPTVTATSTSTPEPPATATSTPVPTATSTATSTPTPTPTAEPVTAQVRLNEVLPVPAQDGILDEFDEWVELHNAGYSGIELDGWYLDDGESGSEPYRLPAGTFLSPGTFLILHGRTTGILLDDTGDVVRLLSPEGVVVDAVAFGQLAPNASYSRDDFGTWHADWPPSPGLPNQPPLVYGEAGSGQAPARPALGLGLLPR